MSPRAKKLACSAGVLLVLALPPAMLMPGALFGGQHLSASDLLFRYYRPWQAEPPPGFTHPSAPHAAEAVLRFDAYRELVDRSLGQGHLPLWNPWNGFGEPLPGHARAAAFYPLDALRLALPPGEGYAWRVACWLVLAGWFTYRLLRCLGVSREAALVGAVIFEMSGFHTAWLHFPHLRVAVLLPFLLWMIERLVRRPESGPAAGIALAVGLVWLADHPETGLLICLTGLVYGGLRLAFHAAAQGGLPRAGRATLWLLIAGGLGVGFGWVQLSLTLADGSWPVHTSPVVLPVENLLGMVIPGLFGSPAGGGWGGLHPAESAACVGAIATVAALAAVFGSGLRDSRVSVFALLAVIGIVASLGTWIRLLDLEGSPVVGGLFLNRLTESVGLAVACLAALGFDRARGMQDTGSRSWSRVRASAPYALAGLAVLAALVTALVLFGLHHPDTPLAKLWSEGPLARLALRLSAAALLAALALFLLRRMRTAARPAVLVLCAVPLVLGELWLHGHEFIGQTARRYDRELPATLASLPPGERRTGVGFVVPPALNLHVPYRDLRGMRSGELPGVQAVLDRLVPTDRVSGISQAGPHPVLMDLGVTTWLSDRSLGPRGVQLAVAGPGPVTRRVPLLVDRPVGRITLHTSLGQSWTTADRTAVAELVVEGESREIRKTLHAGRETGDTALQQYAHFARHPRPQASGSWIVRDPGGKPFPRDCYPTTLTLDPPFVPHTLTITFLSAQGWFNLHRVDLDDQPGFRAVDRMGVEEQVSGMVLRRARVAGPPVFLSPSYRIALDSTPFESLFPEPPPGEAWPAGPPSRVALRHEPLAWSGLRHTVMLAGDPHSNDVRTDAGTVCTRHEIAPGRFGVQVPARTTSTVLVVREAFHPGWHASSPAGEPLTPEPVDQLFLGIVLPPGPAGTIHFAFLPAALIEGVWISTGALALILALGLVGLVQRVRKHRVATGRRPGRLDPPWPATIPGVDPVSAGTAPPGRIAREDSPLPEGEPDPPHTPPDFWSEERAPSPRFDTGGDPAPGSRPPPSETSTDQEESPPPEKPSR